MTKSVDMGRSTSDYPDDLRDEIEETRRELGDTVEELSARTDVKTRAQEKATHMQAVVQQKAAHAKEQWSGTATTLAGKVQEKTPEPVRAATAQVAEFGRRHPKPLIAAGSVGAIGLIGLGLRRKSHH